MKLKLILIFGLVSAALHAQPYNRVWGYCAWQGCIASVYYTGTVTLANPIYSDPNGLSPLGNPFVPLTGGYWFFYAPANTFDITLSAGPSLSQTLGGVWNGPSGGGGGGGGAVALPVTVSGSTVTTGTGIGQVNGNYYTFSTAGNAAVSSGSGTIYVYVSSGGVLTYGYPSTGLSLVCTSGCTATAGVTSFPAGSLPLASVPVSGGVVGAPLPVANATTYTSSSGILKSANNFSIDPAYAAVWVTAPVVSGQTCTYPSIAQDATHLYVCVSGGTWVRAVFTAY